MTVHCRVKNVVAFEYCQSLTGVFDQQLFFLGALHTLSSTYGRTHLQECACAGRTKKSRPKGAAF